MRKNKIPVRLTGQHFTIDVTLIEDSIKTANLTTNDVVLDIGAGTGFITLYLAQKRINVVAIENDQLLLRILKRKFAKKTNVKIIAIDFRNYKIPYDSFKTVSNIPYAITSQILKSLMFDHMERFMGGSLILQLESAQKLLSKSVYNPYVVFYRTFYDITLVHEIGPLSFLPPPRVKSALIRIEKKVNPGIYGRIKEKYLDFLLFVLKSPGLPARTALKKIFRKKQIREIAKKYKIPLNSQVILISASLWSACFLEMLEKVPDNFHPGRQTYSGI